MERDGVPERIIRFIKAFYQPQASVREELTLSK